MESNLKFQKLHLLNVRVSELPLIPIFSRFNFISTSRIFPQFRNSIKIKTSLPINKLHSLSSSSSSAPVSLSENSPNEDSFEVFYLVNTFGWPPELAISKAKHMKFDTPEKPDNVVAFLKKHGFTKTQISRIVHHHTRFILCNPQKTFLPKLGFLSSIGLSTTEIPSFITAAPRFLIRSLANKVIPLYSLLRNLVGSDDEAVEMIKRYPRVLTRNPEDDNIQILQEAGVPKANILVYMTYMREYNCTAYTFRMMVENVKELGFDPSQIKFLRAIQAMRSTSKSTWEGKVQALKKYGWSDREIMRAFVKCPKSIASSSVDKIVGVMDFLVNRMGMEAATIACQPHILSFGLEKRIVPRYLVYQVMLEKGLLKDKQKPSIITILSYRENLFIHSVIKRFEDEAPELLNLYQEMLDKSK